ncbi:MAG TPA: PAC2 family protein [Dermatophilaceae bacterium]|nr:PAC2 family protein [Dermatophilaceae bacterium]
MTAGSYRLEADRPELGAPVLVHGLTGFMDAGGASRLAVEHLLESCEHTRVATFDIDSLYDYRGRRPRTVFDSDHYESVAMPELVVDAAVDERGERFLILHGSEPDTAWGAVSTGIVRLVDTLGVRLVVGMHAIPWPAPHTRPINVTVHANDPTLTVGTQPWVGSLEVPGSLAALIELRLGEQDRPAMGFAAHVPHYLVQAEFPRGALALLQSLSAATGMSVPLDELRDAAEESDADISIQIASNPENMEAVTTLEEQYDAMMAARANQLEGADALPSDTDIAAQVEAFLAQLDQGDPQ